MVSFFVVAWMASLGVACASPRAPTAAPTPTGAQVQLLLATSDLAAEESRFAFGIVGSDGALIEGATVSASFFRLQRNTAPLTQEGPAAYRALVIEQEHLHATGETHIHREARGVYVVDRVRFDVPGTWGVRANVAGVPGGPYQVNALFEVKARSSTPSVGSPAPASRQQTARDVADLREISSRETPLPALYQRTIAEAVSSGRPSVISFSTPSYCQSLVCGPALESLVQVMPAYQGRVEFIHVEPYDLTKLRSSGVFELVPAAVEWGLPSEPWTFVVDAQGRVTAKFEGIVTPEEVEAVVRPLLGAS
ncbi:MAG: hypothetical protein HY688_00550 [Chloroflexi bacterium]|nr:hypothetical protein [Chloroflexota bacterium]